MAEDDTYFKAHSHSWKPPSGLKHKSQGMAKTSRRCQLLNGFQHMEWAGKTEGEGGSCWGRRGTCTSLALLAPSVLMNLKPRSAPTFKSCTPQARGCPTRVWKRILTSSSLSRASLSLRCRSRARSHTCCQRAESWLMRGFLASDCERIGRGGGAAWFKGFPGIKKPSQARA